MTLSQIKNELEEIEKCSKEIGKYDDAHILEDELYESFIEYVAKTGSESLSKKAKLVLKSKEIEFARYCA